MSNVTESLNEEKDIVQIPVVKVSMYVINL